MPGSTGGSQSVIDIQLVSFIRIAKRAAELTGGELRFAASGRPGVVFRLELLRVWTRSTTGVVAPYRKDCREPGRSVTSDHESEGAGRGPGYLMIVSERQGLN